MPLPDAETIRALGVTSLGPESNDRIDLLTAAADAALAQLAYVPSNDDRTVTLESATYTQYYRRPDTLEPRRLTLGLRPIGALTSVAFDSNGDLTYATEADVDDDLVVDEDRGQVWIKPTSTFFWGEGMRAIKVVCTAGWDVSAVPPLTQALALLVNHWVMLPQVGTLIANATSQGNSASFRDLGIPAAVRALLAPYVLWERESHWGSQP